MEVHFSVWYSYILLMINNLILQMSFTLKLWGVEGTPTTKPVSRVCWWQWLPYNIMTATQIVKFYVQLSKFMTKIPNCILSTKNSLKSCWNFVSFPHQDDFKTCLSYSVRFFTVSATFKIVSNKIPSTNRVGHPLRRSVKRASFVNWTKSNVCRLFAANLRAEFSVIWTVKFAGFMSNILLGDI